RRDKREELTVKVPAGVETGARLRVKGKGGEGQGGPAGDLYLVVTVAGDPHFVREGDDIIVERLIRFSEAALGTSLDVPTMEEGKRIKVPAGIQPGTKIRLKGYGFPHLGRAGKGDLYVRIGVGVPEGVTAEQRALLEELGRKGL
ncbi:MAG TPA: DnaJ C-terminal domain-containing protein, partial [Geobacteraceae bacterium]